MLIKDGKAPQGISRYAGERSRRICFTWKTNRAYLDQENRYSKDWIAGGTWVCNLGWYYLGPLNLMKWSEEE
jgi:hypothetical protein